MRAGLAPLIAALLAAACAGPIPGLYPPAGAEDCRTVRMVRHAWHVGLMLPADAVDLPVAARFPDARHLEFGWGDRDYYMAGEGSLGLALQAALLPSESVMHVVGYEAPLRPGTRAAADVIEIGLSRAGLARMVRAIGAEFALDAAGAPVDLGPGLYGDSRFFAAVGTYDLFRSSNAWSGDMLYQAGYPIAPPFPLSGDDLMAKVRAQDPAPCAAPAAVE